MTPQKQETDARLAGILETRDVGCLRCGYNLRGLSPDGRCPECGTPVTRSAAAPLLERIDPRWVRAAARGTSMAALGLLTWVGTMAALGVIGLILFLVVWLELAFTGWRGPSLIVSSVAGAGGLAGLALVVAGQALATRRQGVLDADRAFFLWRRGVRLALATLVGVVVLGGMGITILRLLGVSRGIFFTGTDLYFPGVGLGCVVVVAVFVGYLREVLVRVPDAGLGRRCAACTRMLIGAVVVALLGFQLSNTLLVPLGPEAQAVGWMVAVAGFVGAAGASTWLAFALVACGRRIRACVRVATTLRRIDRTPHAA